MLHGQAPYEVGHEAQTSVPALPLAWRGDYNAETSLGSGVAVELLLRICIGTGIGYLLGAVPPAYLAGRLLRRQDIRRLGDGNCGARNVYLEVSAPAGVAVGLLDLAKGVGAVLVTQSLNFPPAAVAASGLAAVAGHAWPATLGFRGGIGAATALGVLAAALPFAALIAAPLSLLLLLLKRSTVWACAAAFIPLPLLAWLFGYPLQMVVYAALLPMLPGAVHHARAGAAAKLHHSAAAP